MQPASPHARAPCWAILTAQWSGGFSDAFLLNRPTVRVGRRPENDIVLEHAAISGAHVELTYAQGQVFVRDLGSRNGTFLEGQRLQPDQLTPVRPGQVVRVAGCLELRLTLPADQTGALPPALLATAPRVYLTPEPRPGLIIAQRDGRRQHVPLEDQPLKLGRDRECDIVVEDAAVAAEHATISPWGGKQYRVEALGGADLLQGGQPVRSVLLTPGDQFAIGDGVTIEYRTDLGFATQRLRPPLRRIELSQGKRIYTIGRAPENDLRLDDPRVSRYHAEIQRIGRNYQIRDLRSDNGTFVNGRRIEREQFISVGDVIQIAGHRVLFDKNGLGPETRGGLRLDLQGLKKVVGRGKNLLQNISLTIQPNEFVALVGTSGSGKTTLLDAMSGYRPATHGHVYVNGVDLYDHFDIYRGVLGYVPQEDIMHRELTVYQALDYAARLRMPADTTGQERAQRIHQVLHELDLEQRRELPIHQLSGGQRKRVSIGIELLTKPRLFFLDEATSGLDPGTELELMHQLRDLADDPHEGRTIVLVTHATKNISLCDKVIFLTKGGYLAFYGRPDEAIAYFRGQRDRDEELRHPEFDFDGIYNLIDPDRTRDLPADASEKRKLAWAARWEDYYRGSSYYRKYVVAGERGGHHARKVGGGGSSGWRGRPGLSAWRQFWILSARYWAVMRRDPINLAILLLQAPLIGLFSAINLGRDVFQNTNGNIGNALTALFLAVIIVLLFGTVNSAREITREVAIYKRERMVNLRIEPYIFSKVFVGILFCLYQVLIYLLFTLFTTDWPAMDVARWTQLYVTLVLASISGVMWGLLLSAIAKNDSQAVALIPVILIPQFIFAGVLLPDLAKTPVLPQIATSRWAMGALVTVTGLELALPPEEEIAQQQAAIADALLKTQIRAAEEQAIAEHQDREVQQALVIAVATRTQTEIETQKVIAQATAEAQARQQAQGAFVTEAQRDQAVRSARAAALATVEASRPRIAEGVRASLEPMVQLQVKEAIRQSARATAEAAIQGKPLPDMAAISCGESPRKQFSELLDVPVAQAWIAMFSILIVQVGAILICQRFKDTI